MTGTDIQHDAARGSTSAAISKVMSADLIAGVEDILQRKVLACMSANHIEPDIQIDG
jgi:hypothetical protein